MEQDNIEMDDAYKIVKEKESLILRTEMMMQETSIYSESYKPLFIYEMDENQIKDFSKLLNQKLRHVKLAISKANLGQNKYKSENETNVLLKTGPLNPRSKNIMKHEFDPKMFQKEKGLFSLDKNAKGIMNQYDMKVKQLEDINNKERALPKIKENFEQRQKLKDQQEELMKQIESMKPIMKNNFDGSSFLPTASRNVKLPQIKKESVKKEKNKMSLVNYNAIISKYKSKDKMSVAEMFDSYKDEYSDFMLSLINPFSKLSKYIKKDKDSNALVKTLIGSQVQENSSHHLNASINNGINAQVNSNIQGVNMNSISNEHESLNIKFKNFNTSKYSEELSEFSSPKKVFN